MNKLISELQRLYFLDGQQWHSQRLDDHGQLVGDDEGLLTPAIIDNSLVGAKNVALNLVSPDGMVRTMVVDFGRAGDWAPFTALYLGLQNDLNLPAPAVSVSGCTGYGLWLSLAEPVPLARARDFLDALRSHYLADIPVADVDLRPDTDPPTAARLSVMKLPPSLHLASGKWSAFIDPSLIRLFVDGPWLEMAPIGDRQADILSRLESINAEDFQQALILLQSLAARDAYPEPVLVRASAPDSENSPGDSTNSGHPDRRRSRLHLGKDFSDPESFLLAVMNDPSARARHRIAAAKALLPGFRRTS